MKKRHLNIVLALMVVIAGFTGFSKEALAETEELTWTVTYTGSDITSTYDSSKSTIENTLPGDTIQYTVTYTNATSEAATFYVSSDVVKTLEEAKDNAQGGAYSYIIYKNGDKDNPIFESDTVGGDNEEVIGLTQVASGEGAYFSLGSVNAGGSGTVTIAVTLDGNSQSNSYMSTLAELNIQFGAEPTADTNLDTTVVESVKKSIVKKIVTVLDDGTEVVIIEDDEIPLSSATGAPQTGDSILPLVICFIALLVGVLLILWYFKMTKDAGREEA